MRTMQEGRPSRTETNKSGDKSWGERKGLARMFSTSTRKSKPSSADPLRPITAPSAGMARSVGSLPPPPRPASPVPALGAARPPAVPTNPRNASRETDPTRKRHETPRLLAGEKGKNHSGRRRQEDSPERFGSGHQIHHIPRTPRSRTEAFEVPFRAPTLHNSQTFPGFRDPSKSGSVAAHPAVITSRPRGASTSADTTKSPSNISPHLDRPSTASTDCSSTKAQRSQRQKLGLPGSLRHTGPLSDDSGYSSTGCNPSESAEDGGEMRTSVRSAFTSSSFSPDNASTERSSVGTKDTLISDLGTDTVDKLSPKDYLSTVDEAIDMYAAGFLDDDDDDDDDVECLEPEGLSAREFERRVSESIYDAINESMGVDLLPPVRPSSFTSSTSTAIISGRALPMEPVGPPPLRPPTRSRDQYGFLKAAHQVTIAQYDAWNATYVRAQETRVKKWFSYMKAEDLPTQPLFRFPRQCAKTQRFVRKGIPPAWRGAAWFWYAGGNELLQRDPDLYSTLLSCSETALSESDKEMIERDLHRTFPDNIHFKPDGSHEQTSAPSLAETPLLSSLRRVLRAFAVYCPRIGYCQSLNFIVGLLLLFLPEEKAFWMLRIITTEYLPGTHDMSLEGANVDLWVLMSALKDNLPGLWPKLGNGDDMVGRHDAKLPPISLCTTSWFMSLFIGTLPIESVLRVWDVLFYEGSRIIFRTALAIFKLGEDRIKSTSDPMEIFQVVQALPRGMLDVGSLMNLICRRSGISQEWVDKRRKERRKWYAHTRAKSGGLKFTAGETHLRPNPSLLSKADSVWKRRTGHKVATHGKK